MIPKRPEFPQHWRAWQARIESVLERMLPAAHLAPHKLHAAMRYSVLGGGKRFRALLVYGAGSSFGAAEHYLDVAAAAVEVIHAYSLIHDDLPAMDDDELRRGKPTCHIAFGEATAILAGDALQALAFEFMATGFADQPDRGMQLTLDLARACGPSGMAGGQAFDLDAVGSVLTRAELERMHSYKTGALITASILLGAGSAASLSQRERGVLHEYGVELGLAFQIHDDVLDVTGDTETLGKTQGSDARKQKPTYPMLLGLDASIALAKLHSEQAVAALNKLSVEAPDLRALAQYVVERTQ